MKLRMRLCLTEAADPPVGLKALNIEHRTPNIERRILMTLRFDDFIKSEPQNFEVWFRLRSIGAPAAPALARPVRRVSSFFYK
jgi:hypothetical protein